MLLSLALLFALTEASVRAAQVSLALPSGCRKALPQGRSAGDVSTIHITSGGRRRSFLLSIPSTYHPEIPASVILSYHGGGRHAEDQLKLDQLTNPEFNSAAFVIYPQGIHNTWQGVPGAEADDIQFTTDILDFLQDGYCVNPGRISATGKSDGGGFCNVLACDSKLSGRIAAFAPVSGAFYVDSLPCRPSTVKIPCNPSRDDVPFLEFHGGDDRIISYDGKRRKGACLPSIPHFMQQWAVRDGLGVSSTTTPVSRDTVLYRFGTGSKAGLVEHVFDSVLGHDWPSTVPNADNRKTGHHVASFNATPMIVDFFERHPLQLDDALRKTA
ncbi:uncharacterized protein MAM_04900 [Metarhizium album ARSEF 1941]|uniref:feruloyl esterase n=1 Tax=Metarhizium album (strain ARSEF 1941) TaxID=1081103 RepID=A0A0B2WTF3_METAS|nr:uncharacterized protein MAM_04900 [Metarhizium album ARSEF 1941]KHN97303.1 hypothetical protein MAM_04900 [Metarhizium album ARSEF 1941]